MRALSFHHPKLLSLCLAISLLFAQFAIANHPLHVTKQADGQNVELSCAFCIAGSQLLSGPSTPTVHLDRFDPPLVAAQVRSVCEKSLVVSSRLTRGPPLSIDCI